MKLITSILLLTLASSPSFGGDANSGIIYGDKWSYVFSAPNGYTWDSESMQKHGIWGLFWETSQGKFIPQKHNIFINPIKKGNGFPSDIDSLIKWDIDFYIQNTPGLVVNYLKDFLLGDGKIAKAYTFDDKGKNYYSMSAYVCEENASFVFVLVDRSVSDRNSHLSAFGELLKSFVYMNKK